MPAMLILGIESSCDETGVALYDAAHDRLLAHALHSQILMHQDYGGVVPELASRDHIRRTVPLLRQTLRESGRTLDEIAAIAYTQGPGLAGALLVGAAFAEGLATALGVPVIPIHHLEGHLLSPLLSEHPPTFPFIALLVSGGHTQLMRVAGIGDYALLGETLDDAAGEAFDKTAKLLGLPYPGGAKLSELAKAGEAGRFEFPRPMLHSGDLQMSFSGLKTSVLTAVEKARAEYGDRLPENVRNSICRAFQEAVVEVLTAKAKAALLQTGFRRLVVAGGVGANWQLRQALSQLRVRPAPKAPAEAVQTYFPPLSLCTDNGAMIAFAGAMRVRDAETAAAFSVRPRWPLTEICS